MSISLAKNVDEPYQLHVYEEMTTFVERCQKELKDISSFNFSVQSVDPGYHRSLEKMGSVIWTPLIRPRTEKELAERPSFEKKQEFLCFSLNTTNKQYNGEKDKFKELSLTRGGHDNYYSCHKITKYAYQEVKFGLYKKEYFNEAFAVAQKVHPEITEEEFAVHGKHEHVCKSFDPAYDKYNSDYVKIVPFIKIDKNPENIVKTWTKNQVSNEPDDVIQISITIMTTDIEPNSDLLIDILNRLL